VDGQVHAGEEDHARPGWTLDNINTWTWLLVEQKSQSEWQRTEIDGESTSIVWPTLG